MNKETFSNIQSTLPSQPGIYKYLNGEEKIIYVGKAKNLRKRVSSYFSRISEYYKTQKLVSEIERIEFTIVDSEQDALLLENSLIKQYQPKYNISLKDDRSYPHIVIKNEPFPRIFLTRRKINDGSEYFGPYTDIMHTRALLQLIRQTIPLRNCSLNLHAKQISKGKYKPCLEYHIGNCKAPCAQLQSLEGYDFQVRQVKDMLKGKLGEVIRYYKADMQALAAEMHFEKAELVRKKIEYLQNYQNKSIVVSTKLGDVDVCGIVSNEEYAFVNYMVVSQGSIIHTHSASIQKTFKDSDEEILTDILPQLRVKYKSVSKEVITSEKVELEDFLCLVPKGGEKKKLLELSIQNANYFKQEYRRKQTLLIEQGRTEDKNELLLQLQHVLHLKDVPVYIECFDNSNFQGAYPVAAMVCFKQGLPDKKNYRHFHIKTVEGINDFASMKEIVYRRYKRLLDEKASLPQLVIIDGGKGQLSSAMAAIDELQLRGKLAIIGLAKNVEEIFFPGDKASLKLDYQSEALNLIKQIRDEVHRFGITFHRKTRSSGIVKNELENIKGISGQTAATLLKEFKSVKKIKVTEQLNLASVIGKHKAQLVYDYFHPRSE